MFLKLEIKWRITNVLYLTVTLTWTVMNSVKKRLYFSVSTKLYSQVGSPPQEATETCCKDTHRYNSIMRTTADTQRQVSSAEDVCHDTRQECRKSQDDGFVCFVFVNNADACTSIKLPRVVFFSLSGARDAISYQLCNSTLASWIS